MLLRDIKLIFLVQSSGILCVYLKGFILMLSSTIPFPTEMHKKRGVGGAKRSKFTPLFSYILSFPLLFFFNLLFLTFETVSFL